MDYVSRGKLDVRSLWTSSVLQHSHLLKRPISGLWLASDNFNDVRPILHCFANQGLHCVERRPESLELKKLNFFRDGIPEKVALFSGDVFSHLMCDLDQTFDVVNLDLLGHLNLATLDLVNVAMQRLNIGGLLFLSISTSGMNMLTSHWSQKRLANDLPSCLTVLEGWMPKLSSKVSTLVGFPHVYKTTGRCSMLNFGWSMRRNPRAFSYPRLSLPQE